MYALAGLPIRGLADKMTDEEFFNFCVANAPAQFERDAFGNIYIMSPVGSNSGNLENEINYWLTNWAKQNKLGMTFSSSTGFTLPDTSVRSPDAAWLSKEKWNLLSEEERNRFAPVVPDFVIELRSESDNLEQLKSKMSDTWIKNGVQLAWLIDPTQEKAYIYRINGSIEIVEGFDRKLSGENVLEGFELDLGNLRD